MPLAGHLVDSVIKSRRGDERILSGPEDGNLRGERKDPAAQRAKAELADLRAEEQT
jgi:hypothetical protein